MTHSHLTQADLNQFTGTEAYYRHPLVRSVVYTDGVKFLAERAGAYWLIDAILFAQADPLIKNDAALQSIQFWKLLVNALDRSAVLICERDQDDEAYRQTIPYTDFPLSTVTLYLTNGVLLLPSEY